MVLALYINDEATRLYRRQSSGSPVRCCSQVSRVWMLAHRGQMHEDPVIFAVGIG
jgi:hypothetical protein